uniref:DNA sliding clamp PCNA n=1 Tax=Percolomonas cosmopolitus TaxID=63605 RepID=A0A7S1KS54_9EUKA
MFEAVIQEASQFRKIIDSFKDLVDAVNFDCTTKNIQVQAMDGAHVALVFLNMEAGFFDKYRCDRSVSLGVNVGTIAKVMKCASSDDQMKLQAEDDGNQLMFTFQSKSNERNSKFEINLLEIDSPEALQIPETSYSAEITFSSSEFSKLIRDMANFGDTVTIQAKKSSIQFSVGGSTGKGSIVIQETPEVETTKITIKEAIQLTFSLKYLSQFSKGSSLGETVTLKMSEDSPLLVEFPFGDDLGSLKFFLAPKIESDE